MMKKITDVPIRKFVIIKISYSHEFWQNWIQRRLATVYTLVRFAYLLGATLERKLFEKCLFLLTRLPLFGIREATQQLPEHLGVVGTLGIEEEGLLGPQDADKHQPRDGWAKFFQGGMEGVMCVCGATPTKRCQIQICRNSCEYDIFIIKIFLWEHQ